MNVVKKAIEKMVEDDLRAIEERRLRNVVGGDISTHSKSVSADSCPLIAGDSSVTKPDNTANGSVKSESTNS